MVPVQKAKINNIHENCKQLCNSLITSTHKWHYLLLAKLLFHSCLLDSWNNKKLNKLQFPNQLQNSTLWFRIGVPLFILIHIQQQSFVTSCCQSAASYSYTNPVNKTTWSLNQQLSHKMTIYTYIYIYIYIYVCVCVCVLWNRMKQTDISKEYVAYIFRTHLP
jgi:hypothetical protein